MSDKDLIKRGDAEKILCDAYDNGMIDEGELAYFVSEANKIPAVPQEMTAVEFVKEHHRMCQSMDRCFSCCICHDEDSPRSCTVLMGLNPEQTVAIVEQWAAKHPEERSEE